MGRLTKRWRNRGSIGGGGGGSSSSVGGVRVVCALFEDEADNVNNVLVTSVDERILRVGQSTVPKTFIFDQVVTDNTTNNTTNNTSNTSNKSDGSSKLSLSSKLSNAAKDIMNASNGSNGNVCVVSLAGTFNKNFFLNFYFSCIFSLKLIL